MVLEALSAQHDFGRSVCKHRPSAILIIAQRSVIVTLNSKSRHLTGFQTTQCIVADR